MSEPSGLTAEMCRAVVSNVDDGMREIRVEEEVLRLMFGYFIDLSATEAAGDDVLLVASYEPTVRAQERRRQARRKQQ